MKDPARNANKSTVSLRAAAWPGDGGRRAGIRCTKILSCLGFLVMVVIAAYLVAGSAPASASAASPIAAAGISTEKAPDFYLKGLNGAPVSLSSHEGKVVVLTFWASWCHPCKEELASLNRLHAMFKGRGLVILAVSIDRSESAAREYVSRNPLSFTALLDEQLLVSRKLYRIFGVPATLLIDKKGNIANRRYGEPDWTKPEIVKEIETLLQKTEPAGP